MAKTLPSADALGMTVARPGLGVATYSGATGNEGARGRGLVAAGGAFGNLAARLQEAQDEYDTIESEDGVNQLIEKYKQLEHDPETGWRAAQGKNAIKPEFVKTYSDRFEEARKEVMGTLSTANARKKFSRVAASLTVRNRAAVYQHSSNERMAYDGKVTSDSLKLIKDNIWRAHGNDELFDAEMARARALTEAYAKKWSVGAGDNSVKLAVQQMESALWTTRIQGALDSGNAMLAKELFGKATGSLTTDDKMKIDGRLKASVAMDKAAKTVDDIFSKMVSSDLNAAFPADRVDEELRKRFDGQPELLRAARQEADYRASKMRQAQSEYNNQNGADVVDMFFVQRKPMTEVLKSQAYLNLSGDQKAKFHLQAERYQTGLVSRAAAASARSLNEETRRIRRLEQEGEAATLQYMMNPEVVAGLTPAAIGQLALDVGPANANEIRRYHQQITKPGKAAEAKMDVQMFKGILADYEGYKPELLTNKPENDKDRLQQAQLNRIYQQINVRVNDLAQKLKRKPEPEEKEAIMRSAMKERVKADFGFFEKPDDYEGPAIGLPTVGPEAEAIRARAAVPIKEIPEDSLRSTIDFIKKNRAEFSGANDAWVTKKMRPVIERAAAMARMGASREEVVKYLKEGQP